MNRNKDEQLFVKHMSELCHSAYHKEIRIYTDFLNLYEISIFHAMATELPQVSYSLWGGFKDAERKRICFHGDLPPERKEISEEKLVQPLLYPVSCLRIFPTNSKFAESLTHRDYMGAVLNLGIDRGKIGDIVLKDSEAFVFCDSHISGFLIDYLVKICQTSISVMQEMADSLDFRKDYQPITGTVSSIRLDSVISAAFQSSRSSMLPLITGGKVFVNGREILHNSYQLKEGDVISVRGFGKVKYVGETGVTKKGRISIALLRYI